MHSPGSSIQKISTFPTFYNMVWIFFVSLGSYQKTNIFLG